MTKNNEGKSTKKEFKKRQRSWSLCEATLLRRPHGVF